MPKVAVVAKIQAKPGKRDEAAAVLASMVEVARDEEGTLLYVMNLDNNEDDVIWFFELYADDEALGAHAGSGAMKATGKALAGLVAGPPELHLMRPHVAAGVELG
ncbi:MAG: putative quinol monooxygenase [Acidimicrobiales bacterium]